MSCKIAFVMDPLENIRVNKDSTFAMMLAAQARGWQVYSLTLNDLWATGAEAWGRLRRVRLFDREQDWFEVQAVQDAPLSTLGVVVMRKDPPFDMEYIYATYLLELAESRGVLVLNRPRGLRDANEKFFINRFPDCIAPSIVAREQDLLREFVAREREVIFKPLSGMGGERIFYVREDDRNLGVILEVMTRHGQEYVMGQRYLPEISAGDKRVLLIDGEPVPYALARIPRSGESRGNLAAGGTARGLPLSERDYWICRQIAPVLREYGLIFVGIDIIGDYLTEVNVTSPTCIRELDKLYSLDIAGQFMDWIAARPGVTAGA